MKKFFPFKSLSILIVSFLIYSNSFSQLSGTYTIGTAGNYTTINAAVNALVTNGVNGPVTFNILNGIYNEQVTIDSVPGTNATNTVTFKSQSGNAADVIWYNTISSGEYIFTLKINGADFLLFQDITWIVDSVSSGYRRVVEILDYSNNLVFLNNIFKTNYLSNSTSLIYSSASHNYNLLITGNSFLATGSTLSHIRYGIRLEGTSTSYGTKILNNTFNHLDRSIVINSFDSLLIEKNTISLSPTITPPIPPIPSWGIYLTNCNGMLRILKNDIKSAGQCGPFTTEAVSIFLASCTNSLIANNFIKFVGCTQVSIGSCVNQKYYYNTIASFGGFYPFNLSINNSDSILLKNNIYVNLSDPFYRPGVSYIIQNSSIFSNYNNFHYRSGANIAQYNGQNVPNIQTWRTLTGNDYNSSTRPVSFVSYSDLHLSGSSLNDDSLKGIPLTEVTDDIDGDPRDAVNPTMGADEPLLSIKINLTMFIEGFYNVGTNTQVSDTIKAYLRSASSPYNFVDSCIAFVNANGTCTLRLLNAPTGTYYLVIQHRNTIETWSKNGGELLTRGDSTSYDFTNLITQAYGSNMILKGSKYCFYSGDVNKDGIIDASDLSITYNAVLNSLSGYIKEDVNGDNFADVSDLSIVYNNDRLGVIIIRP